MANQNDIMRARGGKKVWNDWAALNGGANVDLSGGGLAVFDYRDFIFPGNVNFSHCEFIGDALFAGAKFKGRVQMDRVVFHTDAAFENAVFEQDAYLVHSHFRKHANFTSAKFNAKCELTNSSFHGETDFTGATFRDAIFRGIQVEHRLVTFESAAFRKVPDFRNSSFKTPPILYGISVDASTKAGEADAQDADKYRYLKMLASAAKDHQNELKFFADELRAKRGHETKSKRAILLSKLYDWFSDYGQSVAIPIYWLGGLIFSSGLARIAACWPASMDAVWPHFAMSLADTFLLVGSEKWELRNAAVKVAACSIDYGFLQHVGALVQSAFGLTLVFLIGLALRNRFKMGSSS